MVIINKLQNGWDVGPLQLWLSHFLVELQPQLLFLLLEYGRTPHFSMCKIASIRNLSTENHMFIGGGSPPVLGVPPCLSLRFHCFAGWPISALAFHEQVDMSCATSWGLLQRSTELGNNKKDEERRKCIAPITNYQHLSTIILYVWKWYENTSSLRGNMWKNPVAWIFLLSSSHPKTSDQTQIISDPFPPQKKNKIPEFPTQSNPYSGLTAIRSIHGPMAGWDDFTDLRRGKLTQAPAWWQIGWGT